MTMKIKTLVLGSLVPLALFAVGCGDETESRPSSASSASASSGGGGEGTGGAGTGGNGAGGEGTGGAGTGGNGAGGEGTGGQGGSGSSLTNGCDMATAQDETGKAAVTIKKGGGFDYDPKCVVVSAGTDVTWSLNLSIHPLVGGDIIAGTPTADPNSPIKGATSGMSVTYKLMDPGAYGYYCSAHAPGMAGAVFVK
jgi:plastocyanin